MPKVFQQSFQVRHYECDAYGHLNNANYLRYMQEAAFNASANVGYDFARYRELGSHWLVRYSDIEYLYPLQYGDQIIVDTWVEDFHRVRSIRAYKFRVDGVDKVAAKAYTDWVYLDSKTLRPISIPDRMIRAFSSDGRIDHTSPRRNFHLPTTPSEGVHYSHRSVEWRDLDAEGHVNNAVFLSYIEESGVQVAGVYGWSLERLKGEDIGILARRHQIDYRLPAFLGDELKVGTWISEMGRSTAIRNYVIIRPEDERVLARVSSKYVWINLDSGKPVRIPAEMREDFRENIALEAQSA
jgi:acyl-CoA thioester hydrolase